MTAQTTAHTHDEQLAAARLLLNLEAGADIVDPLKALMLATAELRATLRHVQALLRIIKDLL